MDKFGVEESVDCTSKVAGEGTKVCPSCGQALRNLQDTGVLLCSQCGSKPFETAENAPNKSE